MKRGIPVRRSKAAAWARLTGALSLPTLVLGALGSRVGMVPGSALIPALGLGFGLALAAVALAAYALARIWRNGAQGAGSALAGLIYAVPALLALAGIAAASFIYPRVTDVATDPQTPPELVGPASRPSAAAATGEGDETPYPDLRPHFYAQPPAAVYEAARQIVEERGWEIVGNMPPASASGTAPAIAGGGVISIPSDAAILQAVAPTPVVGFLDDVAIRLLPDAGGTRVDMRSASRIGRHDLGQNARRIRRFFSDLDAALQPDPNAPVLRPPLSAPPSDPVAAGSPAPPPEVTGPAEAFADQ
jgi:hypothetical protein